MKMIDFTHTKRPDFIQLVLIIAVACLALGVITPAASAVSYDWDFSVHDPSSVENVVTFYGSHNMTVSVPGAPTFPSGITYRSANADSGVNRFTISFITTDKPATELEARQKLYDLGIISSVDAGTSEVGFTDPASQLLVAWIPIVSYPYSYTVPPQSYPFNVDVVDSGNDYLISVSGFDGTQLAGSAYTIAVSTYSGGYNLPLTSFPMYLGDSPVHLWTTDQTFTLPVYLSDGVTPIDYYCVMSFPADSTATGYPFWWNMTTHGSLDYPFNTTYPPVVIPTPPPLIPSDIIPDPNDLNNTVNFTGWYQDQGFEGNNITAPIYSGLRGWFSENMIPVFDFFLMPIGSLSSMISESAGTSTDAISDSVEQLSNYAAPMNIVGGYVVLLVPDVVWVVVFAALSIGYVVLLIRISTGSIRDTIGRFLGRW